MSILKELNRHTNSPIELKNFLNFLIGQKVYDPEIYLKDLKNSDNSNILLKSAAYQCWAELDKLVPHLPSIVLEYKNNTGLTFPQQYMMARPESEAQITSMYKKCPKSFLSKSVDFNPFKFNYQKSSAAFKSLYFEIAQEHLHHLHFIAPEFFSDFVHHRGLAPLAKIDNQDVVFRVFYSYMQYRKTTEQDQSFNQMFTSIVRSTPELASERKLFIQKFLLNDNMHLDYFFSILEAKPEIKQNLGLKMLTKTQDSLTHLYLASGGKDLKVLDFLLEHVGHYNTLNAERKDIHTLAQERSTPEAVQFIESFIERKMFNLSLSAQTRKKANKL